MFVHESSNASVSSLSGAIPALSGCTDNRSKEAGASKEARQCQAVGCTVDLEALTDKRQYCMLKRICPFHMSADVVHCRGITHKHWRFCQQCGKLEPLSQFDGTKRSCRASLERRRIQTGGSLTERKQRKRRRTVTRQTSWKQQQQQQCAVDQMDVSVGQAALLDAAGSSPWVVQGATAASGSASLAGGSNRAAGPSSSHAAAAAAAYAKAWYAGQQQQQNDVSNGRATTDQAAAGWQLPGTAPAQLQTQGVSLTSLTCSPDTSGCSVQDLSGLRLVSGPPAAAPMQQNHQQHQQPAELSCCPGSYRTATDTATAGCAVGSTSFELTGGSGDATTASCVQLMPQGVVNAAADLNSGGSSSSSFSGNTLPEKIDLEWLLEEALHAANEVLPCTLPWQCTQQQQQAQLQAEVQALQQQQRQQLERPQSCHMVTHTATMAPPQQQQLVAPITTATGMPAGQLTQLQQLAGVPATGYMVHPQPPQQLQAIPFASPVNRVARAVPAAAQLSCCQAQIGANGGHVCCPHTITAPQQLLQQQYQQLHPAPFTSGMSSGSCIPVHGTACTASFSGSSSSSPTCACAGSAAAAGPGVCAAAAAMAAAAVLPAAAAPVRRALRDPRAAAFGARLSSLAAQLNHLQHLFGQLEDMCDQAPGLTASLGSGPGFSY